MTNEEAVSILESWNWRFAKSMPNIPHSYARKSDRSDVSEFFKVAMHVKDNGVPERFYSKTYKYLYTETHKYWVMYENIAEAEIINRAELR
tara:strand:+ start:622 stop:894 length:273 start_codon:yes stop_codon:yes gene_type:complete